MNSLDPKITLAVYIGGAVVFVSVLLIIFFYTRSMKAKQAARTIKGQPEASVEEGILLSTEKKEDVR